MNTLKIPELDALAHLEEVIAAIPLDAPNSKAHAFVHWKAVTKGTIGMIFGDESTPVKDFVAIRWETDTVVWDVHGNTPSSQLMATQRKVDKEAMERGFAEAQGLLKSLKNKVHHTTGSLELMPDDPKTESSSTVAEADEWDRLSTEERAIAMQVYGSYDHYLPFAEIPGSYGSLVPVFVRICLSLRKKKILEFHGDQPQGQILRFIGHTMKEASEKRSETVKVKPMATRTNKIFIVHGHDAGLKNAIRSYIGDLGLTPVILHEQPDRGRTVIEKFEQESGCDFAVISATADDLAATAKKLHTIDPSTAIAALEARARQNVIFELGYFVGKIGRGRVMLITDLGIELPSDFSGVVFTLRADWNHKLWKELKASGFSFTVEQIERATAVIA